MAPATSRQLYVNLAVEDLERSVGFFTALGFSFNPTFTDEHATCMILSDEAFVMLLVKERFKDFTTKQLVDSTTQTEVILAVSAGSRAGVDELVDAALAGGGSKANDPTDEGFMYLRSFQDLDGHQWEVMWMDPAAVPE